MKKIFCLVLTLILFTGSLCSCGSDTIIVTYENGSTENLSVEALIEMEQKDGRKFDTITHVSGRGTMTSIELHSSDVINGTDQYYIEMTLDNNLVLHINLNDYMQDVPYMEDYHGAYYKQFYNGDTVTFSADIHPYVWYGKVYFAGFEMDEVNLG